MTGDLPTNEFVEFRSADAQATAALRSPRVTAPHEYGRVTVLDGPEAEARRAREAASVERDMAGDVTDLEALGAAALAMRNSEAFRAAKRARPYEGLSWDLEGFERTPGGPTPLHAEAEEEEEDQESGPPDAQQAPELGPVS